MQHTVDTTQHSPQNPRPCEPTIMRSAPGGCKVNYFLFGRACDARYLIEVRNNRDTP